MKKSLFYYTPAVLWAAFVFVLCSMPPSDVNKVTFFSFPNMDKVAHFTFYFTLVFLLMWAEFSTQNFSRKRIIIWLSIAIGYGILIEILQGLFFAGRSASFFDASFNTLGAILGFVAFKYVFLKFRKN